MESCPTVCLLPSRTTSKQADDLNRSSTVYITLGNLVHVIEELKCKDKIISQLERQLNQSTTTTTTTTTTQGATPVDKWLAQIPPGKNVSVGEVTLEKVFQPLGCSTQNGGTDSGKQEEGPAASVFHLPPIEECSDRRRLAGVPSLDKSSGDEEREIHVLTEKNSILLKRLSEMERRSKPLQDRCKKYIENSMELTSVKRHLEDQLKVLTDENNKLKEQLEHYCRKLSHVTRQLTKERSDKQVLKDQTNEIEELHKHLAEQNKTIADLKQTCSEKDRRIELIQYRKRKQRKQRSQEMLAGVKEAFYGYDADNQSVDSELSSMSFDNSVDDDSWDEFAKEEFQENYRILSGEHIALQKSYSLLQSRSVSHPRREPKPRSVLEDDLFKSMCEIETLQQKLSGEDSSWLVEKRTLKMQNEYLEKKVNKLEQLEQELRDEIADAQEREEKLEFKLLELESMTSDEIPVVPLENSIPRRISLTNQMMCLDGPLINKYKEIFEDLEDLVQQLDEVSSHSNKAGTDASKLAKLKAAAFLGILDKTLKDTLGEPALSLTWETDSHREEKLVNNSATTTTAAAGDSSLKSFEQGLDATQDESKDAGEAEEGSCSCNSDLTTEALTAQLTTTQKRFVKLENVFHDVSKAVEVYKDRLSMADEAREWDRTEIQRLRAQIGKLAEDPSLGGQVLKDRLTKLELAENRADDLQKTAWELQSKVISLQQDKHMLEERLEGSEHGRIIILAEDAEVQEEMEKLRTKVSMCEKAETEALEKNLALEKEIHSSQTQNAELTTQVDLLNNQIQSLKSELDSVSQRHDLSHNHEIPREAESLKEEISQLHAELEEKNSEINHLKNLLIDGDVLEQIRQIGQEMEVIKEENQLRGKACSPDDKRRSSVLIESKGDNSSLCNVHELQQDLQNANALNEQLRKKLRLAEDTINDLESSEGELRENLEVTEKKENDHKKHIKSYQKTIQELRDQLADRDIIEESLQEKMQSLVNLEDSRAKRISELESIEASLRHRLELKDEIAIDFDFVASLEATIEDLQAKNRELQEKVEELEESETILKKNWKAVAEEDTSRIMLLEEKVRTLDATNHQLKNKLREDEADAALIEEIVFSPLSGQKSVSRSESNLNNVGRLSVTPGVNLQVEELENRLQLVTEEKNSKIELLQEKLDDLRETEIKLSETVYEMEQEEKHLRAKLALYENSVVTVENMAMYEDKLEEMKNSEHDLLDRMNSLENREYDLKDKLVETELKYRSEVDKLERNISNYQKLEEKLLDKIHDLETKNMELEKKAKQSKPLVRDVSRKPVQSQETEKQLNDLRTRVRELRAKVSSLEKQNKELKEKLSSLNSEREELLTKNNELQSRLSHLEYLEKKVEVLQDAEAKFSERVLDLEEANSQLEEQLVSQKGNQEASSVSRSALFEKNQQLEEENQNLSLLVQRQSVVQVDTEALCEKVSLLEQAEGKLMERVMQLEESEEQLKVQLARAEEAAAMLPELQNKLDTKEETRESLQATVHEWQEKYNTLTEEIASIENTRAKDKQKISMLLAAEENLTETLTTQQKHERELEEDLEASEEKVEELQLKTEQLQAEVDRLKAEIENLRQQQNDSKIAEDLQAELEATQEKLEEVQTEYEQTIEDLKAREQQQWQTYEDKINNLIENEKLTKQTLQEETTVKVSALHAKIEDVSSQLEKQLELNKSREEIAQKLSSENTQQKEKIGQLEMLVDALKSLQPESEFDLNDSNVAKNNNNELVPETKRYQTTCSFTFQQTCQSPQPDIHQGSFENKTVEGSETESQTHAQTSNISADSSLDELLQERERLLIEIEELKYALGQAQVQSDRVQKITIEETKSEFITKEIIYKAKVDQLKGKLSKESNTSPKRKSNLVQDLKDTVDELQKREVLYCKEIERMHDTFHKLRQTAQLPKGPVINLPHENLSNLSQKELIETVHAMQGEKTLLKQNMDDLNTEFLTFREALGEITACLREDVLDGSPSSRGDLERQKSAALQKKFSDLAKAEAELVDRINLIKFSGIPNSASQEGNLTLSNSEYESLVMELREKVDILQERESRLKRRLYDKSGIGPNTQVRKLYDRIIDLEASESKLQRQVEYLRLSEEDLHRRLGAAHRIEPSSAKKSVLLTSVLPKRDSQKEELQITIDQLQKSETSLNQRVAELCQKNHDLTQKVRSLQGSEQSLKRRLELTEVEDKGDNTMLEKPDEILRQRVWELEKIEKQLKKQVTELGQDREELHELASRDKSTIHEQNTHIHELQLSEKALKKQVNSFELSERLLHVKIQNLQDELEKLEDQLKQVKGNESKYQEILKKYKLEGELHAAKSETMVATVEELSNSETALKKRVYQLEMENSQIVGKSESLDKQLKDVEDAKTLLDRHLKEAQLEKKALYDQIDAVQHLKGTAHDRNEELAKLNQNLSDKILKLQEEKAGLVYKLSQSQIQLEELERRLGTVKESELKLQHKVNDLEKCEQRLHKEVKEFRLQDIDSQAKLREMEQEVVLLKDQLTKLRHREKTLRYRIQELENANPGMVLSNMAVDLESSTQFNNYQEKILILTQENENLKAKIEKQGILSEESNNQTSSVEEVRNLQAKITTLEGAELRKQQLEMANEELKATINELHENQHVCGHEEEVKKLKDKLDVYNETIQRLQKSLEVRSEQEKDVNTSEITEEMILPEVDRKHETSVPMASGSSSFSRKDAIAGIIASLPQEDSDLIVRSLRNSLGEEEVSELMQKIADQAKEKGTVIEEEHWQKVESMNFGSVDDTASEDSHWGKVETARRLNQSHSSRQRSKGTEHEEITMELTLPSDQSQVDSDSSSHENIPPTKNTTRTITLFKTKTHANQFGAPPPLPSSLPPSLPAKGAGPVTGLSSVDFSQDTCDSADEVPDFEEYDTVVPPFSAKSAPGLRSSGDRSREATTARDQTGSLMNRLESVQKHLTDKEPGKPNNNPLRWRKEAEENARQLGLSQNENKNLKDQINKLEQEVEEKSRYIEILETLLRALDNIMDGKGSKTDEEITRQLSEALQKTKSRVRETSLTSHSGVKDNAALVTDLQRKERDFVSKCNEVSSLRRDLHKWQNEYETVEQMRINAIDSLRSLQLEVLELQGCDEELRDLKEKHNKTLKECEAVEREKQNLEKEVTTLQSKLTDLTNKCQERDEKIQALTAELEELKVKLDKLPLASNGMNGNGSVSSPDISFQDEEIISSTHRPVENERPASSSSASLDGLPARSASVDPTSPRRRVLPTARSMTPSPMSNGHSRAREARFESRVTLQLQNGRGQSRDPQLRTYVAVANYNPSLFSRSNRPGEELKLQEGDTVYVKGEKDDQGYYQGEVNGKTGLVPASYLLPLPIDKDILRSMVERRQQQLQKTPDYLNQSPEQILQLHGELQRTANDFKTAPPNEAPKSTLSVQLSRPRTAPPITQEGRRRLPQVNGNGRLSPREITSHSAQTLPRLHKPVAIQPHLRSLTLPKRKPAVFQGPPSPPCNFAVERTVGDHGVMLSWQPPELDEFARSNGSELSGYVIYLNGRVCKKVTSPHISKVVIENLDINDSLKFLIQSMAVNGQASSLIEAIWDSDNSFVMESSFDVSAETDLSSVLSSVQYDQGHKRSFLAIYDYSPIEHSPHDYTGCELGFNAGETIAVYGRLRPDGFYHGEINGKRGLVPASFIEEVPPSTHHKKNVSRANLKLTSQRHQ